MVLMNKQQKCSLVIHLSSLLYLCNPPPPLSTFIYSTLRPFPPPLFKPRPCVIPTRLLLNPSRGRGQHSQARSLSCAPCWSPPGFATPVTTPHCHSWARRHISIRVQAQRQLQEAVRPPRGPRRGDRARGRVARRAVWQSLPMENMTVYPGVSRRRCPSLMRALFWALWTRRARPSSSRAMKKTPGPSVTMHKRCV